MCYCKFNKIRKVFRKYIFLAAPNNYCFFFFFLYKIDMIGYTSFSVGKYENINARQICAPLYDRFGSTQAGRIYPSERYFGAAGYFDKIPRTDHFSFEQIRTFAKRTRTAGRLQTRTSAKSMATVSCLEANATGCSRQSICATIKLWEGLGKVINAYLDGITLDQLTVLPETLDYSI